jgi:hypothetical protein
VAAKPFRGKCFLSGQASFHFIDFFIREPQLFWKPVIDISHATLSSQLRNVYRSPQRCYKSKDSRTAACTLCLYQLSTVTDLTFKSLPSGELFSFVSADLGPSLFRAPVNLLALLGFPVHLRPRLKQRLDVALGMQAIAVLHSPASG